MKKTDLAYLAGFFDGEGCIQLRRKTKCQSLVLRVTIGQPNRWILECYRMAFGGSVRPQKLPKEFPKAKPQSLWAAADNIALEFLKVISPYLTLKQGEAKIAIQFQETKALRRRNGRRKLTEEQLAIEAAQRLLVHNLKDKSKY